MDIKFAPLDATVTLTLTCPFCSAVGEPSVVTFDHLNSAWTETDNFAVVPCTCRRCNCCLLLNLELPK